LDSNKNIEQFDELFKQALNGTSAPVPPNVWQGVSGATSGGVTTATTSILSKILGLKGAAIIGGAAIIITSIVVLTSKEDGKDVTLPNVVQTAVEQPIANVQEVDMGNTSTPTTPVTPLQDVQNSVVDSDHDVEQNNTDNNYSEVGNTQAGDESVGSIGDHATTNDVQTNEPHTGIEAHDVIESKVELWSSTSTCCVSQSINFELRADQTVGKIVWLLDGKRVGVNQLNSRFIFENKGHHTVKVTGLNENKEPFELNKTIEVGSANADFKVESIGQELLANASHPWSKNQWFVNQFLVEENRGSTLISESSNTEVTIVHIVTDVNGCMDTTKRLAVIPSVCDVTVVVKNVFTPYVIDGINDLFVIELPPVDKYWLSIFNMATGSIVFETQNQDESWNGKQYNQGELLPQGKYTYQIVYTCDGDTKKESGIVTLLE